MTNYPDKISIKHWAEADRPREKLLSHGSHNLSNAELLAILIGSGTQEDSAVDLARKILHHVCHDLNKLGRSTIHDLMTFRGIGQAKAITITAALELGRRRQAYQSAESTKITSSAEAYKAIGPYLSDLSHEEFWILLLNQAGKLVKKERIGVGGINGVVADGKIIFHKALTCPGVTSIILVHNHPSGNLTPSQADIQLTHRMNKGAKNLDLFLMDHLIIAGDRYYSFRDEHNMA